MPKLGPCIAAATERRSAWILPRCDCRFCKECVGPPRFFDRRTGCRWSAARVAEICRGNLAEWMARPTQGPAAQHIVTCRQCIGSRPPEVGLFPLHTGRGAGAALPLSLSLSLSLCLRLVLSLSSHCSRLTPRDRRSESGSGIFTFRAASSSPSRHLKLHHEVSVKG